MGSEVLPDSWTDRSEGFYSLLYIHPKRHKKMFLIKLIPVANINDEVIMGNLLVIQYVLI